MGGDLTLRNDNPSNIVQIKDKKQEITDLKKKGNDFFKSKNFEKAIECYKMAL
jgi:hypothetical protein